MDSIQFKKNPVLGQMYWEQVCGRDAKAHIFHPLQGAIDRPRTTALSTSQLFFSGTQGLVHDVVIVPATSCLQGLGNEESPSRQNPLASAARTSLGGLTPRPRTGQLEEVPSRLPSRGGPVETVRWPGPTLSQDNPQRWTVRGGGWVTPSRRDPAGA
mmetsp:Transcript_117925/g.251878  ORF Transcript_117925/g.251878 Transcript_117925/m.251878 type:complete len:157 (-) Transcript_117925:63-533(-)